VSAACGFALEFDNLRIGYGSSQVLHVRDLRVPHHAITALVGPVAAGKSSLMRHLVGLDRLVPTSWASGRIRSSSALPGREGGPARMHLVAQKARLYLGTLRENILAGASDREDAQARLHGLLERLAPGSAFLAALDRDVGESSLALHRAGLIFRALLEDPDLLLLDEPLSDVAMADEAWLLELLGRLRDHLTVLMVSHNKNHVRQIADLVVFVTGGEVVEVARVDEFFSAPRTELARAFLASGSAWPAPRSPDPEPEPEPEPPPAAPPWTFRELGLRWILPGRLGGMHQPGLLGDIEGDFRALSQLGVTHLVTLTEAPLDLSSLTRRDIEVFWFPIEDMGVPDADTCREVLRRLTARFDAGANLVFHCRGGLGRTGLMLACFLIAHRDMPPALAIEHVRKINPNYIQTPGQLDFVMRFARNGR